MLDQVLVLTLTNGSAIHVLADSENVEKLCAFLRPAVGPDGIPGNSIKKGEILTLQFDGRDSLRLPASL